MNTQTPWPLSRQPDGALTVHSVFPTIQGEGPFSGRRAVFVRLAGCNLQCPGCDTEYTATGDVYSPSILARRVAALASINGEPPNGHLVVITGGEPFRQNIAPFAVALIASGFLVQIETNGTLWNEDFPSVAQTVIVCSPKTSVINPVLAAHAAAFKYVLQAGQIDADGLPLVSLEMTKQRPARPPANSMAQIFVSPFDEGNAERNRLNGEAAAASVMRHGYRISLQTHKYLNLP